MTRKMTDAEMEEFEKRVAKNPQAADAWLTRYNWEMMWRLASHIDKDNLKSLQYGLVRFMQHQRHMQSLREYFEVKKNYTEIIMNIVVVIVNLNNQIQEIKHKDCTKN